MLPQIGGPGKPRLSEHAATPFGEQKTGFGAALSPVWAGKEIAEGASEKNGDAAFLDVPRPIMVKMAPLAKRREVALVVVRCVLVEMGAGEPDGGRRQDGFLR